jgi:UDP-2,3-diacylglucosamine pyrophosphatase LpxH
MNLPTNTTYVVIGDVHGCIDELKTLLKKQGFTLNEQNLLEINEQTKNTSIILLGDFIDKASEEKLTETIEFIYQNYQHLNQQQKRFYLILGNHEEMVYRYLMNDQSIIITPKSIENKEKYYNTVALLEKNLQLKEKFIELYHACDTWLKYKKDSDFSVSFTHAPCEEKYLTKEDETSRKQMIKCISRSKNPKLPLDELIPYSHQEAKESQHYHIFGHLSQPNIRQYKNKICIDTSAIYGNTLSCAIIQGKELTFDSTPFENRQQPATQTYNKLFDF